MDRSRKSFSGYSSLAVIAAVLILLLIIKDTGTTAAVCWLAVVFSVSFFMRPYMPVTKLKYFDSGFGLTFGVGLFICFYFAWTVSAVGVCDFSDGIVFASFVLFAVLGFVIKRFAKKETYITADEFKRFLNGFAIFALIYLAFYWMIGFNPTVDPGTENYMDFGFMTMFYRQKSAIPEDIWFAGSKLNYYYLGQAVAVYMCRLSGTTPEYGYNLMLATLAGMTFIMSTEIASAVAGAIFGRSPDRDRLILAGGFMGGTLAAFGASMHWAIYGVIAPLLQKLIGTAPSGGYWFADPTVYISKVNGDPDNGKTEFPAYSFMLGDLHAHVVDLIFVLPLVGMLFDLGLSDDETKKKPVSIYRLILISMLLSFYKGANYWDFAIYYVITGALIVFTELKSHKFTLTAWLRIAISAAVVTFVSYVVILPFTHNFVKMESGIELCTLHTPLIKFLVLWGVPIAITLKFVYSMYFRDDIISVDPVGRCALLALALCTIGLTLVPEVIFVKDIYGGDNKRFNTMFKLTFEASLMFALIIGMAFSYILCRIKEKSHPKVRLATVFLWLAAFTVLSASYTGYSVYRWMGNVFDTSLRKGISSFSTLRDDGVYGFEMEAYDVLMQDDKRNLHIIEMAGNSYSHSDALSVYSGACTPVGWFVHEWMWHNNADPVRDRSDVVSYFYTSGSEEYCKAVLKQFDIDYILVGPAEVCRYPVNWSGFTDLGKECIATIWQDARLALIKVDKSKL